MGYSCALSRNNVCHEGKGAHPLDIISVLSGPEGHCVVLVVEDADIVEKAHDYPLVGDSVYEGESAVPVRVRLHESHVHREWAMRERCLEEVDGLITSSEERDACQWICGSAREICSSLYSILEGIREAHSVRLGNAGKYSHARTVRL